MATDIGRDPTGQALAVPVEPASSLAPTGFDPSRVRRGSVRQNIRGVAKRFVSAYPTRETRCAWRSGLSWGDVADGLNALDVETATVADVEKYVNAGWVEESCDLCDRNISEWLEVGEEPDYEARWVTMCFDCVSTLSAIATEARRAETA